MASIVTPLYQYWTETDGEALENGKVFIGVLSLDPETNPIAVFWDVALTIPAVQPLRTIGGIFDNNGTPSDAFVDSGFSITVKDANDVVQFLEWDGAELAGFAELTGADFTGAVSITSDVDDKAFSIDGSGDPYMQFDNSGVEIGRISGLVSNFEIKTNNANLTLEAGGATPDIRFVTNSVLRGQITDAGNMSLGPAGPSGSALFDLQSNSQGFLPPRMNETERDAILAPVAGLIIYNTDTSVINVYNGTTWLTASIQKQYNWVMNGTFNVNQRGGTKTPGTGVYGYDRWIGDIAGLKQTIEALPAGEYTFSWVGGGNGTFGGTTAVSPITASIAGGDTPVIVPSTATDVQLVDGDNETGVIPRMFSAELALCQRYYCILSNIARPSGAYTTVNISSSWVAFPVQMRTNTQVMTFIAPLTGGPGMGTPTSNLLLQTTEIGVAPFWNTSGAVLYAAGYMSWGYNVDADYY